MKDCDLSEPLEEYGPQLSAEKARAIMYRNRQRFIGPKGVPREYWQREADLRRVLQEEESQP